MLDKYITWFKAHERLLLIALVLLVGHYGVKHYLDNAASADKTKADVAVAALASQKAVDVQLAAQSAQATAQYQAMIEQLAKAVSSRDTGLQAQKGTDSQLPLSGLALRLQALGNAPVASVSVDQNSIILTQPGAVAITQTLEEVPVLQANLLDTRQLLTQSGVVIGDLHAQVSGLTLAGVKADEACKAEVAQVKSDARKSKLSWFKRGLVVGFIGGLFVGHAAL